jgi:hypothetical protein
MVVADTSFRHSAASKDQMRIIAKGFEERGEKLNLKVAYALLEEWCKEESEDPCSESQLRNFLKFERRLSRKK